MRWDRLQLLRQLLLLNNKQNLLRLRIFSAMLECQIVCIILMLQRMRHNHHTFYNIRNNRNNNYNLV